MPNSSSSSEYQASDEARTSSIKANIYPQTSIHPTRDRRRIKCCSGWNIVSWKWPKEYRETTVGNRDFYIRRVQVEKETDYST
jgi:hypothetical protein